MSYLILGGLAVGAAFCAYWAGWHYGVADGIDVALAAPSDPLADALREQMRDIRQQRVWVGDDEDLMISNSMYVEANMGNYDIIVMEHRADFERECG